MAYRILVAAALVTGVFLTGQPAMSHHSFAMFDIDNKITLTGVVREFQWSNPHVIIWINVEDDAATEPITWAIEMTSVGNLRREGWNRETLKPGDNVELVVNPLRNGEPGAGFFSIKFLDTGREFLMQRTAPPSE